MSFFNKIQAKYKSEAGSLIEVGKDKVPQMTASAKKDVKKVLAGKLWIIEDWAGNVKFGGKTFKSFEDAEEYLSIFLGDKYETDREEYEIVQK